MSMTAQVHERWAAVPTRPLPGPDQLFSDPDMPIATADNNRVFADRISTLTVREHEVLRLRAQGLINLEIADRCFMSAQTVKNHLHRAVGKLGVVGIDGAARVNRACYLLGRFEYVQERQAEVAGAGR